jgi:hypothetical protein
MVELDAHSECNTSGHRSKESSVLNLLAVDRKKVEKRVKEEVEGAKAKPAPNSRKKVPA